VNLDINPDTILQGDSTLTKNLKTAVVYQFPCSDSRKKGSRCELSRLIDKALTECFNNDLILLGEAYSVARIDTIAKVMETHGIEDIQFLDSDDYLLGMIAEVKKWLTEAKMKKRLRKT
jgi:hypothetical protein